MPSKPEALLLFFCEAGFGALGLLTFLFGAAAALADGEPAWVLVHAAIASPFLLTAARGVRNLRKQRRHRQDAFVHGVPIRARITLRSQDPPALWWEFKVDGVRHENGMVVERAAELPVSLDDTEVWVLHHPKKPRTRPTDHVPFELKS